jgi:hypothetical protein
VTNGDGSLAGVIRVTGDVPELPPLIRQKDLALKEAACATHDVPDESLLVDRAAGNGLANVFVYLAKAPAGYRAAGKAEPVEFDQRDCRFLTRVVAVQIGQPVLVKSGDPFAHNVNNEPVRNTKLNVIVQPNNRVGVELIYDRAEPVPVKVKCDIHPWMRAWHLVGKHKLRVWHERAGLLERGYDVDVKAGEAADVSLSYPVEKFSSPQ